MAASKTKKALVPKLRFKEFDGSWNNKKLGDIAQFQKGKGISKSDIIDNGELDCIRYGELYTHYNETIKYIYSKTNLSSADLFLSEYNDVIIPASGETQIDIAKASCVLLSGVALGGDLNVIRTNIDGVFLSFYLNSAKKFDIARLAQGSSVMHLYSGQLKSLKLHLPTLPEQQKIAAFLSAVDEKIQQLTRKKELLAQYKKGVMQQLFPSTGSGQRSGKLRFKIENKAGELVEPPKWEERMLGEIGVTFNGLTGKTKENFGEGVPYIQYMQIFANSKIDISKCGLVQIEENENQQRVQYGDVFFTTSSETPNEIGTCSVLLENIEEMYLNSFCFGYRPYSFNILLPQFAQYLFRSQIFRRKIIKLAQGSTRYNMSKVELMKLKVNLPTSEEQQKIATYLSSIDSKIEFVSKQIIQTQTFKKGLLQQMFV